MSEPFLQARDLVVERDGRPVVEVAALELRRGELLLLRGENGAGKTTLIMALSGLLDLARGRIAIQGQPFPGGRAPAPLALRRQLALVQQTPYLFSGSVLRNVTYGLRLRGLARAERRRRAGSMLERLGIAGLAGRRADRLSVGEQKLVALARALVLDCPGVLLDEVTASLDEAARARVLVLVRELAERENRAVLLASHLESVSASLPARQLLLRSGRLVDGDA